ncbi:UNKNOWN [Stylonychia lemnae]|uniref:Uncharacterized protein n=1 Tax=Stylonychia lemnae TaxID=5949 RepID=A0A078AYS5_STYLE|nr:UNKNOWN [Stylonychia lemnae]|eukprot:CDW87286.1 UNKNOWN [Stylonychia lemnae]
MKLQLESGGRDKQAIKLDQTAEVQPVAFQQQFIYSSIYPEQRQCQYFYFIISYSKFQSSRHIIQKAFEKRDLEHKIMEFENKNEKIEDELKFQHQIMSTLVDDVRRIPDIDQLIEEFEQTKKKQIYFSGNGDYIMKIIDEYTIDDFQNLLGFFPQMIENCKDLCKQLKRDEKVINKENEVVSKKIQSISSAIMIKDMENRQRNNKKQGN